MWGKSREVIAPPQQSPATGPSGDDAPPGASGPLQTSPETSWLLRLRWGALLGQALLVIGVDRGMALRLPLTALLTLVAVGLLSQVALLTWLRRGGRLGARGLLLVLGFDSLLLTAQLALSGGPFNPFSIFLLVNLALGAILLPARASWALVGFSLALFGGLFLLPEDAIAGLDLPGHAELMTLHLQGMWVASAAAACFIVHFVQRITRALDAHATALAEARRTRANHERIRGLATLAAGTAHELSTPLSTIAVASAELVHLLGPEATRDPRLAGALSDAALIREQVRRCREVLQQLADEAGHPLGETLTGFTVGAALREALEPLPDAARVQLPEGPLLDVPLHAPRRALIRSLRSLLKNALQATEDGGEVRVSIARSADTLSLGIADTGVGMRPEVFARAFEPFHSTRAPGEGMGLGLYLARGLAEQLGGALRLDSTAGVGTQVTLELPCRETGAVSGARAGEAA